MTYGEPEVPISFILIVDSQRAHSRVNRSAVSRAGAHERFANSHLNCITGHAAFLLESDLAWTVGTHIDIVS